MRETERMSMQRVKLFKKPWTWAVIRIGTPVLSKRLASIITLFIIYFKNWHISFITSRRYPVKVINLIIIIIITFLFPLCFLLAIKLPSIYLILNKRIILKLFQITLFFIIVLIIRINYIIFLLTIFCPFPPSLVYLHICVSGSYYTYYPKILIVWILFLKVIVICAHSYICLVIKP